MLFKILGLLICGLIQHRIVSGNCIQGSPPCQLTCHCEDTCRGDISAGCVTRTSSCEPGWDGPICQRQNVVYGSKRPFVDTGSSLVDGNFYRSKAFDGNRRTSFRTVRTGYPYLWVNLKETRLVGYMKLYTLGRYTSLEVHVSNKTDFRNKVKCNDSRIDVTGQTIWCGEVGQYVHISIPYTAILVVNELEIYKCGPYFFGENCDRVCNCRDPTEVCHWITGQCPQSGCPLGITGDCFPRCGFGYFGENCKGVCHCSDNNYCNKTDGSCSWRGCARGYTGYNCQDCHVGLFGKNCNQTCHCKNQSSCNSVDGRCDLSGCADGFDGRNCQDCLLGRFGSSCTKICRCKNQGSCDQFTGECDDQGCIAGYRSPNCQMRCYTGNFGENCLGLCHCKFNTECNTRDGSCGSGGCARGYTGYTCQECSSPDRFGKDCKSVCHCKNQKSCDPVSGRCDAQGCAEGFQGGSCQECQFGLFGRECEGVCHCKDDTKCSKIRGHCSDGQCAPGYWYSASKCQTKCWSGKFGDRCSGYCRCKNQASCDHVTGACDQDGCAAGYKGDNCQTACDIGWFGEGCKGECHCRNDQNCDKENGNCKHGQCSPGYLYNNRNCQTKCPSGRFGLSCVRSCHCKTQASCDHVSGTCDQDGCAAGYKGDKCQQECSEGEYGESCSLSCGNCQGNTGCDKINGTCHEGCQDGYVGHSCHQPFQADPGEDSEKSGTIGGIVGAIVCLIILAVIIVAAIFVFRKRRRKKSSEGSVGEDVDLGDYSSTPVYANTGGLITNDVTNPAHARVYENTCSMTRPSTTILAGNLLAIIANKLAHEKTLANEFERLPSGLLGKVTEASKPDNVKKCRYKGILPYDHTRVVLSVIDGDTSSDFINASYINGYSRDKAFIASQGTTAININDFWRMIWDLQVETAVMLTHLFENGKQKALQYWPVEGTAEFGDISVEVVDVQRFLDHTVRNLKVQQGLAIRTVTQFHFLEWRDHSAPRHTSGAIEFREKINGSLGSGPIVVHCSAGVGRTGTYIAFDFLMKKLHAEREVDIFQTVVELRHQRPQMIQSKEQYVFLHKIVRDAFVCGESFLTSNDLTMMELDSPTVTARLSRELEKLEHLRSPKDKKLYSAALLAENAGKNRDLNCIPADADRVWLSAANNGKNNYINALYVPAGVVDQRMIATQMPFGDTIVDFWRMIYEQKCTSLILLNSLSQVDDQYWPMDGTPYRAGPFEVSLLETHIGNSVTLWKLSLKFKERKNNPEHVLKLYCFTGWSETKGVPNSPADFIELKADVFSWQCQADSGPIVVQCRNGSDRSALYCACDFLLDRLKAEHSVNIPLTVNRFRGFFSNGISSEDQYLFCYQVTKVYIDNFNVYANFS